MKTAHGYIHLMTVAITSRLRHICEKIAEYATRRMELGWLLILEGRKGAIILTACSLKQPKSHSLRPDYKPQTNRWSHNPFK